MIKLTSGQHKPREPRPARGSLLRRARQALWRGARAIQDFNSEQIGHWERFHQAGRRLVTHEGPLAWVSTLDGYRLVGRHLPVPAGTGLMVPHPGKANLSPAGERRDRAVVAAGLAGLREVGESRAGRSRQLTWLLPVSVQ